MAGSVGSEDGDVGFQIAPMVDVVFVLMLFFMASAGQQVTEKELSTNLPSGVTTPGGTPVTPMFVDISPDGTVTVNGQAFDNPQNRDMPQLKEYFKNNIVEFGSKDPVIIRPNPEARHERIIDVLNAASKVGVKNLTFS